LGAKQLQFFSNCIPFQTFAYFAISRFEISVFFALQSSKLFAGCDQLAKLLLSILDFRPSILNCGSAALAFSAVTPIWYPVGNSDFGLLSDFGFSTYGSILQQVRGDITTS